MGWFEEQIEYRRKRERELLTDSFQNIAASVIGHKVGDGFLKEDGGIKDAVSKLLKYYNIREKDVPAQIQGLEERLKFLLSSTGVFYRKIQLEKGWSGDAMGAMIAELKEDGSVITLLPGKMGGYTYLDPHTGRKKKIDSRKEEKISREALCFYRPFPARKMKKKDLWIYMRGCISVWDLAAFVIAAVSVALIGTLLPKLNQILIGYAAIGKDYRFLVSLLLFMLGTMVGSFILASFRQLLLAKIDAKVSVSVNAAAMMRVLSLPADFFRNYSSGELRQYLANLSAVCSVAVDSVITAGLTLVYALIYFIQILSFAKELVVPAMIVAFLTFAFSLMVSFFQIEVNRERMQLEAKEKGLLFALISGIQKIRLAGAEKRAFSRWADSYAKEASLRYNPPMVIRLSSVFTGAVGLAGMIIIFYAAIKEQVPVSDYYAFNVDYAYITSAFTALAAVVVKAADIRPALEYISPLFDTAPEVLETSETVVDLSGSVEISHVSFRYQKESQLILDDLSLSIPAKQYVAIVGKTGCGKSTLFRLLLGFEAPTKGSIFYDRKDTRSLNMRSVRQKIGTVMQDGKLFQGSVFDNIAISAPMITVKEAWEAAEIAGIAEDIRRMPMKMHTMISEGSGGISGGQRQRLLIARAVALKPKILLLDEATSALDNITQKQVSDALAQMNCTRIVIAHRLSTIRNCDRILVLDHGRIEEDGTYDELIAKKGIFAELVERQGV